MSLMHMLKPGISRRLRFSSDADIVRLTNARIIIIIIIICMGCTAMLPVLDIVQLVQLR